MEGSLRINTEECATVIAANAAITDESLRQYLAEANREISGLTSEGKPVPIALIRARRVLVLAFNKRRQPGLPSNLPRRGAEAGPMPLAGERQRN